MDLRFRIWSPLCSLLPALATVLLLSGCGRDIKVSVRWDNPTVEVQADMPTYYKGIRIGIVEEVERSPVGTIAHVKLAKDNAFRIRIDTVFWVDDAPDAPGLKVLTASEAPSSSPGVVGGEVLRGTISELEVQLARLKNDWPRTLLYLGVGVVSIVVLIGLVRMILGLLALILSLAGGIASAYYLTDILEPILFEWLPDGVRVDLAAHVTAFGLGFLVVFVVFGILRTMFRRR